MSDVASKPMYIMYTQSQTDISSVLWNDSPNRTECPMKFHKVSRTLIIKLPFLSTLYFSLLSVRYFELYNLPKVRHRFRLLFIQTDNFITNSSSISSILVPMYQEDFHLWHYQQFPPKLLPQHTENGQSLRFPQIRKVNLHGWHLNSESGKPLLFSDIPNDVSERCQTEVAHSDWLMERSVWVVVLLVLCIAESDSKMLVFLNLLDLDVIHKEWRVVWWDSLPRKYKFFSFIRIEFYKPFVKPGLLRD